MKRLILTSLILLFMGKIAEQPKLEPKPIVEPAPIEAKPVLVDVAKFWVVGKTPVAYYQRVTMPDGTRQELKIRRAAATLSDYQAQEPTKEEWKALVQKQWNAQVAAELNKPKPCTHCGGSGVEPQ